jgi:hypothetical protein
MACYVACRWPGCKRRPCNHGTIAALSIRNVQRTSRWSRPRERAKPGPAGRHTACHPVRAELHLAVGCSDQGRCCRGSRRGRRSHRGSHRRDRHDRREDHPYSRPHRPCRRSRRACRKTEGEDRRAAPRRQVPDGGCGAAGGELWPCRVAPPERHVGPLADRGGCRDRSTAQATRQARSSISTLRSGSP